MLLQYILFFAVAFPAVEPARILGIFPMPSISHQIVFRSLTEELAKRGHTLVILTPNPSHYTDPVYSNITEIDVKDESYKIFNSHFNFMRLREENSDVFETFRVFSKFVLPLMEYQMQVPAIKKLLEDPDQKFDLCIFEALFMLTYPLKDRFNCSMITFSSLTGMINNFESLGVPTNPIIYMDMFSSYSENLNFWERMHLVYNHINFYYLYYWKYLPRYNELSRKLFGDSVRSIDDIEKDADIFFVNVQPLLRGIRPIVPSVVFLGSIHIKKPKPLPSDLKKILDTAKNGFIYLSFGSNVKSVDLAEKKRNSFLMAFKDMPYTVLWKWENDTMPNKPKNVYISKWMPQQDILAHPNIKVFVTHGGQQSVEEAIDRKVPMVGMPFLVDQDINVKKMYKFGIGLGIDLTTITVEIIRDAVNEVITNPGYRQNISKLHDLLYDHPQSSLERAVWWTEYVLRHGGASHLRSPAINVPFYQYFLLDIIGFILICCFLIFAIIVAIIKCILHIRTSQFDLNINMNHLKKFQ